MSWTYVEWIVIGIATVVAVFLWVYFSDKKKPVILREEGENKVFQTRMVDGVEEVVYEFKKARFQRYVVLYFYLEFMKDYLITVLYQPFQVMMTERYAQALWMILLGYPILVVMLVFFYVVFLLFKKKGILCVVLKLEDPPVDRFGQLLDEETVKLLTEKEKGHELFMFYAYFDKQGQLRASTKNIVRMINDSTDYLELTTKLGNLVNINAELLDEFDELAKLIPVAKLTRKKLVATDDNSAYKYECYVWEYSSDVVLKMLLQGLEDKEKAKKSFLASISMAHIFTRVNKEFDKVSNQYHQLLNNIPLQVNKEVAKRLEEISVMQNITVGNISYTDVQKTVSAEQASEEFSEYMKQKREKELFAKPEQEGDLKITSPAVRSAVEVQEEG